MAAGTMYDGRCSWTYARSVVDKDDVSYIYKSMLAIYMSKMSPSIMCNHLIAVLRYKRVIKRGKQNVQASAYQNDITRDPFDATYSHI